MSKINWTLRIFNLDDLTDYYKNPRSLSEKEFKQLKTSLDKFGMIDKLIVNADSVHTVIGGHQRKHVLEAEGVKEIECWTPDRELSDKEVEELNIRLNKNTGSWDFDTLANEFELDDLLDWGFDKSELDLDLWNSDAPEDVEPQLDKAEELREKWGVETGQLWQLGEHRLICGDCTDKAVVEKVMGGDRAVGTITSPPYAEQRKEQYGGIRTGEYVNWWKTVQENIKLISAQNGSLFLNIKPHIENFQRVLYVMDLVLAMVRDWNWLLIDELVWVHQGFPTGDVRRYKNQFEPIYHFSISDEVVFSPVTKDWSENSIFENEKKYKKISDSPFIKNGKRSIKSAGQESARVGNVLQINNGAFSPVANLHSATFPIQLPEFFILSYSKESEVWFEPFSGSGTTLIACERLGRKCRAVEISPAYCAVAIQRWVDVTGKEPVKLSD